MPRQTYASIYSCSTRTLGIISFYIVNCLWVVYHLAITFQGRAADAIWRLAFLGVRNLGKRFSHTVIWKGNVCKRLLASRGFQFRVPLKVLEHHSIMASWGSRGALIYSPPLCRGFYIPYCTHLGEALSLG